MVREGLRGEAVHTSEEQDGSLLLLMAFRCILMSKTRGGASAFHVGGEEDEDTRGSCQPTTEAKGGKETDYQKVLPSCSQKCTQKLFFWDGVTFLHNMFSRLMT